MFILGPIVEVYENFLEMKLNETWDIWRYDHLGAEVTWPNGDNKK